MVKITQTEYLPLKPCSRITCGPPNKKSATQSYWLLRYYIHCSSYNCFYY